MYAQVDAFALPSGIFALVFLLLLVIFLLQCAKAEKNSEVENGTHQKHESSECIANKVYAEDDPVTACEIKGQEATAGREERSPTESSIKLDCVDGEIIARDPNELLEERAAVLENQSRPEEANQKASNQKLRIDADGKEKAEISNGSGENSGDSIYTRVKSVAKKEECAYSVVELADQAVEYELVDGKLQRLEKSSPVKESQPVEDNDYEMVSSVPARAAANLDPVIFAAENSGSSGIYEDVGDSKVSIQESKNKENEPSSTIEAQPEQKTKKWGLTRFSLKNKAKSKNDQSKESVKNASNRQKNSPKGDKDSPVSPRNERTRASLPDIADLHGGSQEKKSRQSSVKGVDYLDDVPPPPPLESLKLKMNNRKTIHVTEPVLQQEKDTPRRTSVPVALNSEEIAATHWPISKPNVYSQIEKQDLIEECYDDMLYDEPDKDIVTSVRNSRQRDVVLDGKDSCRTRNVVNLDQTDNRPVLDYETISCSLDIPDDMQSDRPEINSREDAGPDRDQENDPMYAKVKKPVSKKISGDSANKDHDDTARNRSQTEGKIDVFIKKTKISSHLSGEESKDVQERTTKASTTSSVDDANEDEAIRSLYAEVDMAKKREGQAIKALYASVNKVKTGICKYYDDDGNDLAAIPPQEYEDGHYTKIRDLDAADHTSGQNLHSEMEEGDYELVTEQKNLAMFTSIRESKQTSRNTDNHIHVAKNLSSEYEVVSDLKT